MKIVCDCGNEVILREASDKELRNFIGGLLTTDEDIQDFKRDCGTLGVFEVKYPFKGMKVITKSVIDDMLTITCGSCHKIISISTYSK